jgi:DNA polymerase III alpha subunit
MNVDKFGQIILSEDDLCDLLMEDPDRTLSKVITNSDITFDSYLELDNLPIIEKYISNDISIEEFDIIKRSNFHMPEEYKNLDIFEYVINKCSSEKELIRCYEELVIYQDYDMLDILRYMVYLVDVMRKNNILWGVGRGSSVSSFVLYLIGIHRINSLQYDLSFDEFIK